MKKKHRTNKTLKPPSFLERLLESSPSRKNRKRRSQHIPDRNVHDADYDSSDAATSVSCQSNSAHNLQMWHDGRIEGDASNNGRFSLVVEAEAEAATMAAHITGCHPLANGWFDVETGRVEMCCVRSPPPPTPQPPSSSPALESIDIDPQRCLDGLQFHVPVSKSDCDSDGMTDQVRGRLLVNHSSQTYYGDKDNWQFLQNGGALYSFTCRPYLTPYETDLMRTVANLTSFDDEVRDNSVPAFDVDDAHDIGKYTFVIQKAAYVLPGVRLGDLTPQLLSSAEYHRNCQPNGAVIWDDVKEPNTFRFTRPIVRHVYYMTIQFRVSRIEGPDLVALSQLMGIRVDHGILMERTKRSRPPRVDGTAKAKSILCYTAIAGGVLVTHATVILNTAIPSAVSGVIHTLGGLGLYETSETVEKTRRYLASLQ